MLFVIIGRSIVYMLPKKGMIDNEQNLESRH